MFVHESSPSRVQHIGSIVVRQGTLEIGFEDPVKMAGDSVRKAAIGRFEYNSAVREMFRRTFL